jgi:uncharacterized protein YegP (UPF0339 family)
MKVKLYHVCWLERGWKWIVVANNGYVIARSENSYARKWTALRAIKKLVKNIKTTDVEIIDGQW